MNQLCILSNMSSSDWAAWAQAIVSALAIVAGAFAVRWQVGRQAQDARRAPWVAQHDYTRSVRAVVLLAAARVTEATDVWVSEHSMAPYFQLGQYDAAVWRNIAEEVKATNLAGLNNPYLAVRFRLAQGQFTKAQQMMEHCAAANGNVDVPMARLTPSVLGSAQKSLTEFIDELDRAMSALNLRMS